MATKFVPLTAALIDEGELIRDIDEELGEAQRGLVNFRKKFGEQSVGAKATVTVKVELSIVNAKDDCGSYGIKTQVNTSVPKRPASVSMAMDGETQDDKPSLFVQQSGSAADDPRQTRFAKRDGTMIDQPEASKEQPKEPESEKKPDAEP